MAIKITLFSLIGIYISYTDIKYRIIPDLVTIPLIVTGILYNLYLAYVGNLYIALLGLSGGIFAYFSLYLIAFILSKKGNERPLGGGDAKLYVALGFWLGLLAIPIIIFLSSLLAVIFTFLRSFLSRWVYWSARSVYEYPIPLGPYIFLASLIWVLILS